MERTGMIQFNAQAGEAVCFSLSGVLAVFPVRFSFPAPELNFSSCFSVSARIQTEWKILQERANHFFISVAGLIHTASRKIGGSYSRFYHRTINVLRSRILKLSTGGRRL